MSGEPSTRATCAECGDESFGVIAGAVLDKQTFQLLAIGYSRPMCRRCMANMFALFETLKLKGVPAC